MKQAFRCLVVLAFAAGANAQVVIKLNNSFIDDFKNRATITATYSVVKSHHKANPPAKDGDTHSAGTAPEIGLAAVAEIMNAKDQKKALNAILAVEGSSTETVKITGAWRIWPEHAGGNDQVQGAPIPPFNTTNPDHVFQVHPIVTIDDIDVRSSLHPIAGFTPKDAEKAFLQYENMRCKIIPGDPQTTIMTNMAGFNYVKFAITLNDDPVAFSSGDGTSVFATVNTLDGELLVRKRRMIFIKDTPPDKAVRKLHKGDSLTVLGIPRVDLALVAFRRDHAADHPEVLDWNLPYEIIVVGVFPG